MYANFGVYQTSISKYINISFSQSNQAGKICPRTWCSRWLSPIDIAIVAITIIDTSVISIATIAIAIIGIATIAIVIS